MEVDNFRVSALSSWASISTLEKLVVSEVAPDLDLLYSTQSESKAQVAVVTDKAVLILSLSDTKALGYVTLLKVFLIGEHFVSILMSWPSIFSSLEDDAKDISSKLFLPVSTISPVLRLCCLVLCPPPERAGVFSALLLLTRPPLTVVSFISEERAEQFALEISFLLWISILFLMST